MDVRNNKFENNSNNMRSTFAHCFDWDNTIVGHGAIDVVNKEIICMCSDYDWHLLFWNDELDLQIGKRLTPGIEPWHNYPDSYLNTLSKFKNKNLKTQINICTRHDSIFELTSLCSTGELSSKDMINFLKLKPTLSDYANQIWKTKNNQQEISLPLRDNTIIDIIEPNDNNSDALDCHPYMRFGNIRFTQKEIIAIRYLLSHRRVKEIAALQGCSATTIQTRINRIKEKLDCQNQSSAVLFKALKEHGVTLACLDILIKTT
ncbi:helix-turn-helix transcriptional regulator [Yersinia enterocolitica]|uniref:helix-turn-helix transcriptional regulator n=1 Tax=Yersinia enterocolitica TaxID=630 RepID=UPI001C8EA1BE|nr:helix-turn-helix transcriptional regulator [Yersinia enterocolitica]MBX9487190.1 helix-turn-helix transcriptional regulator [Yersinia enterocolitica]MBX9493631.1 helix-turn-helix transcriptional regulator [Yersinia enterocolitica]